MLFEVGRTKFEDIKCVVVVLGSIQESGVIQTAQSFNNPLIPVKHQPLDDNISHSLFVSSSPSVIIDTVKVGGPTASSRWVVSHCHSGCSVTVKAGDLVWWWSSEIMYQINQI